MKIEDDFHAQNTDEIIENRIRQRISEALKRDSSIDLPDQFADRVIKKLQDRSIRVSYAVEICLSVLSLALIIASGVYVVIRMGVRFEMGILTALQPYTGLAGFCVVTVLLFNYFEKRLFKGKIHDSNH